MSSSTSKRLARLEAGFHAQAGDLARELALVERLDRARVRRGQEPKNQAQLEAEARANLAAGGSPSSYEDSLARFRERQGAQLEPLRVFVCQGPQGCVELEEAPEPQDAVEEPGEPVQVAPVAKEPDKPKLPSWFDRVRAAEEIG